jgi:hypothetical protein
MTIIEDQSYWILDNNQELIKSKKNFRKSIKPTRIRKEQWPRQNVKERNT